MLAEPFESAEQDIQREFELELPVATTPGGAWPLVAAALVAG